MPPHEEFLTVEQILHLLRSGPEALVPLVDIVQITIDADPQVRDRVEYLAIAHIGEHCGKKRHQHRVHQLTEGLRMINILPYPEEVHPPT